MNTLKTPYKLKGAVFSRYLQEDYKLEQIQIADKKGTEASVQTLSNVDIDYLVNKLGDEVQNFLVSINYDKNASDLLCSYNKADAANKTKLLNIYKKYSIGTDGDNTYKISKNGAVIASGEGNDTFTLTGKYGDSSILASDYNGDSVIIKNYAFSKNNLEINKSENSVNIIGSETVKGVQVTHNLELVDFAATNGNTVSLKDKSYQYELSYNKTNWLDYNINRVAIIDKNGTNTLTYKNNTVTNKGNHDIYLSLGNCNDTYRIENFDTTTDLAIFDSAGNDTIIFTNSELNGDIRLFANFDSEGNVLENSDTYLIHREGINKKNISKTGIKNGIRIVGAIETVTANNGNGTANADVDSWIDALGQSAANWLGDHSKYSTTAEVFSKGSSADINSLLQAVYLDNPYTTLVNMP